MKLGLSKMFDEWFDEHRRLALPNEWRSCSNHCLRSRDSHRPEENNSKLADEPLKDSIIEAELDKCYEKYNRLDLMKSAILF